MNICLISQWITNLFFFYPSKFKIKFATYNTGSPFSYSAFKWNKIKRRKRKIFRDTFAYRNAPTQTKQNLQSYTSRCYDNTKKFVRVYKRAYSWYKFIVKYFANRFFVKKKSFFFGNRPKENFYQKKIISEKKIHWILTALTCLLNI